MCDDTSPIPSDFLEGLRQCCDGSARDRKLLELFTTAYTARPKSTVQGQAIQQIFMLVRTELYIHNRSEQKFKDVLTSVYQTFYRKLCNRDFHPQQDSLAKSLQHYLNKTIERRLEEYKGYRDEDDREIQKKLPPDGQRPQSLDVPIGRENDNSSRTLMDKTVDPHSSQQPMEKLIREYIESDPDGKFATCKKNCREILLYSLDGYSQIEIAKYLQVNQATVSRRMNGACRKLYQEILDSIDN